MFHSVTSHLKTDISQKGRSPSSAQHIRKIVPSKHGPCGILSRAVVLEHPAIRHVSAHACTHLGQTRRASTRASSPSTPTTGCGVFASMTCHARILINACPSDRIAEKTALT